MISRPVRGLRPLRAARRATTKVPKPLMVTRSRRCSASRIEVTKVLTARSAETFEPPDARTTMATRSALVTQPVYAGATMVSMVLRRSLSCQRGAGRVRDAPRGHAVDPYDIIVHDLVRKEVS